MKTQTGDSRCARGRAAGRSGTRFEWQWYCKAPGCGASGTAYYTCPTHGVFSTRAYGTDQRVGPPDRYCPICNQQCSADSAVCNGPSHHRYYKPGWIGY